MDDFYELTKNYKQIMRDCRNCAVSVFIERKDKNYRRCSDNTSFEDLLEIFSKNKMHWVFIKRKPHNNPMGHYVKNDFGTWDVYQTYYEVGGCTLAHKSGRDYFLFMYLPVEEGDRLVKKYRLNLLKNTPS